VGEAKNGDELIQKYIYHRPKVVLADISMPGLSGFEAFKQIKNYDPSAKFLFLSMYETPEYIHYARKIGAQGLIGKNISKPDLINALELAAKGIEYFGPEWPKEKLDELDAKYENLADSLINLNVSFTYKEREILTYISEGLTSDEIAKEMNLSKRTVDSHRFKIMKKVNADNLSQLITFAIKYCTINNLGVDTEVNPSK
jgi:DNA-binding NarL/FixJ family response regulator